MFRHMPLHHAPLFAFSLTLRRQLASRCRISKYAYLRFDSIYALWRGGRRKAYFHDFYMSKQEGDTICFIDVSIPCRFGYGRHTTVSPLRGAGQPQ